jgi:hypothetical protein
MISSVLAIERVSIIIGPSPDVYVAIGVFLNPHECTLVNYAYSQSDLERASVSSRNGASC